MVRSKQRTKRRRFHGNRFTSNTKQNVTENKVVTQQIVCTSAQKLIDLQTRKQVTIVLTTATTNHS